MRPAGLSVNKSETGRPQGVKEGLVAVQVVVERFLFRTVRCDHRRRLQASPRRDEKGNEIAGELDYMLRYEEFIPMCIYQIQKLKARVAKLERGTAQ